MRGSLFYSPSPCGRGAGGGVAQTRILLTADAIGGVWRYAIELAAGLRALGAEVLLVGMGPAPSAAQCAEAAAVCELRATDLALDWLAETPAQVAQSARGVASIAEEWGAGSIHLHTPALVPATLFPAPVVAVAHSCVGTWWRAVRGGAMPPALAWRAALVAEGLRAADAVIAPTRAFAAAISERYGLERAVCAIHNGRRPLPCPSLPRSGALTAGRLWDEAKNLRALDDAAGRLDIEIRAAGPPVGPNGAALETRNLRLLGALDEPALAAAYAGARVFVSVARYEPFGLAVLEAAQAGCALVLSDIPTFRELWDGAARFVDPDDADAIARTVADTARNPFGWSDAARRRAGRYTASAMAAATFAQHRHAALVAA